MTKSRKKCKIVLNYCTLFLTISNFQLVSVLMSIKKGKMSKKNILKFFTAWRAVTTLARYALNRLNSGTETPASAFYDANEGAVSLRSHILKCTKASPLPPSRRHGTHECYNTHCTAHTVRNLGLRSKMRNIQTNTEISSEDIHRGQQRIGYGDQ